MDGGTGFDYARYDDAAYGDIVVSMANPTMGTGAASGDTFTDIEGLILGEATTGSMAVPSAITSMAKPEMTVFSVVLALISWMAVPGSILRAMMMPITEALLSRLTISRMLHAGQALQLVTPSQYRGFYPRRGR